MTTPVATSPLAVGSGWDALASDGSVVHVRPLRVDNEPALRRLNYGVSERTVYLRFFTLDRGTANRHAHHLTMPDAGDQHVVLVAELAGRLVAVGSLEPMGPGEAEVAFLVDDGFQGHGIGTLLLEQLVAAAREHGIHHVHADTLLENTPCSGSLPTRASSRFAALTVEWWS